MALKIDAGDVKRGDFFFVDPFEVIVKEEDRGRHKAPEEGAVIRRALSFLEPVVEGGKPVGQLQAVEARRVEGNKLQLNMGFTRTAASRLIREGFDYDGRHYHDPNWMLKVTVVDCNAQDAFMRNVVENAQRDQTSPIDDAFNHEKLRGYGMSDVDIARLYGYGSNGKTSSAKVCRLRKLLGLESEYQDMVHTGRLSVQAALDLLDLPPEKRKEVMEAAGKDAKVSGSEVRSVVRDHILNDDGKKDSPAARPANEGDGAKSKPRTIREIRKFLETTMRDEGCDPAVERFCQDTLKWVNGRSTDKAMANGIARLLEARPAKK